MKINPNYVILLIAVIIVLFLAVCYSVGSEIATEDDDLFDIISKGINVLFPSEDISDDEDGGPDTGDDELSWTYVERQGAGFVDGNDYGENYVGLGDCPPFTSGNTATVRITFYHAWTGDCAPCTPGIIWCLEDSLGNQLYHVEENNPSDGTETLSPGVWDGVHEWRVFFGNNCPCQVYRTWKLKVMWLE